MTRSVVIVAAKRTPIGAFQGVYSKLMATDLGATAIRGAMDTIQLPGEAIQEAYMGCVLPAGLGQAPARQAAIHAGIPYTTPCTTLNKVCGSGLKAIMIAYDQIRLGYINIAVAGGMESMTRAPYLLDKARGGYRLGHGRLIDSMLLDGLEDAYEHLPMGVYAEETATKYGFTREAQDAFACESLLRTRQAMMTGLFQDEIVPVLLPKGEPVTQDETPTKVIREKIPNLKPAFKDRGTVTAATSSSIADGAAAVILMSEDEARRRQIKPLARILAHASHSQEPQWYTTAPIGAMTKLAQAMDIPIYNCDLYEINEAFAVVTMAATQELKLGSDRVNVHGGACTLGHPIGASGARILVTLIHALHQRKGKRGVASLCIGGGEAVAMGIEIV